MMGPTNYSQTGEMMDDITWWKLLKNCQGSPYVFDRPIQIPPIPKAVEPAQKAQEKQEEETTTEEALHQCPCCKATKCKMDEPCLGCETYAEWCIRQDKSGICVEQDYKWKDYGEYFDSINDHIEPAVDWFGEESFNAAREKKK